MSESRKNVVDILLVEDNPGDVRLAREALRDAHVPTNLHVANDGEQAIRFLEDHAGNGLRLKRCGLLSQSLLMSVRSAANAPAGTRPCAFSHALMSSTLSA